MNTKILKQKILSELLTNNEWKTVKLGDVCEKICAGGDKPNCFSETKTETHPIPIFSNGIKDNGLYGYTDVSTIKKPSVTISARGTIGFTAIRREPFCPIVRLVSVTPKNDILDIDYLYYVLTAFIVKGEGSSIQQLTVPNVQPIEISLPSLAVQKQIVSQIETLFAEIDRIEQSRQNLLQTVKMARQKALQEFLNGEWKTVKLGDVCEYGKCKTVITSDIHENAWILDLEDIEKDTGKLLHRIIKKEKNTTSVRYSFKKGNVLYSKLRTYLNKVLVADMNGFCTTEIIPIDFNGKVIPEFARFVLMSPMFLEYTEQCCYGVKMPRLGANDAKKADFPLPPLPVQKQIVEKIEAVFGEIEKIERAII